MNFRTFLCFSLFSLFITESQGKLSAFDNGQFDWSVRPGDDFFQFVNGQWLNQTKIPPSENQWGSIFTLMHDTSLQLKAILDDLSMNRTSELIEPIGSIRRQLADLYLAGLDEQRIESAGLQPLNETLRRLDKIDSSSDLLSFVLNQYKRTNNGIIFKFEVTVDEKNSSLNIPIWKQSGIELPSRNFYLKNDPRSKNVRSNYIDYIHRLLRLTDPILNQTTTFVDAEDVFTLELQLAVSHKTETDLRNAEANYNSYKINELDLMMPNLNWSRIKNILQIPRETFNIKQPDYYRSLDKLINSEPLTVWKNKIRYSIVHEMATYLNKDCFQARFEMFDKLIEGREQPEPRWKKILDLINDNIGEALGQIYVARHFDQQSKQHAISIAQTLIDVLKDRIRSNEWMSSYTKEKALKKLNNMRLKIGYPIKWTSYENVHIERESYFNSVLSIFQNKFQEKLTELEDEVNRDRWIIGPQIVNAYYDGSFNEVVLPAAILQKPFFSYQASDAENYGGIGFVFGHELVHGFDDQGRKYDENGNLNCWWAEEDVQKFQNISNRLVEQFNKYQLYNFSVNGQLTLGENIADLVATQLAYAAFLRSQEAIDNRSIDGYTAKQRFFLSLARSWRVKNTENHALLLLTIDEHAPFRFRINGPLSNFREFYEAFNVQRGDALFREQSDQIKFW